MIGKIILNGIGILINLIKIISSYGLNFMAWAKLISLVIASIFDVIAALGSIISAAGDVLSVWKMSFKKLSVLFIYIINKTIILKDSTGNLKKKELLVSILESIYIFIKNLSLNLLNPLTIGENIINDKKKKTNFYFFFKKNF